MNTFLRLGTVSLGLALMAGCDGGTTDGSGPARALQRDPPEESGTLHVVTRNGSTTYYLDRHQQAAGPEHSLINEFAAAHGWDVAWDMQPTTAAALETLRQGEAHIAAAGLTHIPSRSERFTQGPAHTEVVEQLVCHREMRPLPRTPDALGTVDIHVTAGSSYAETLDGLAAEHPDITYDENDELTTEVLLSRVAERSIDCAVADSNIVQAMRRHFPHLEIAMNLGQPGNLGWYLPAGAEDLADTSREWMNSQAGNEAIAAVENRFYSYIGEFDFVDMRALTRPGDAPQVLWT